jgi:arsenical pump membrane protein
MDGRRHGTAAAHDARATITRILPLLVFLGSVIVLARLDSEAQLFDVLAFRLTALGRGRTWVLFPLCVLFAAATTIFLNLDTTRSCSPRSCWRRRAGPG